MGQCLPSHGQGRARFRRLLCSPKHTYVTEGTRGCCVFLGLSGCCQLPKSHFLYVTNLLVLKTTTEHCAKWRVINPDAT